MSKKYLRINERVWSNLPLQDFIHNTQFVLARLDIGIGNLISLFNHYKTKEPLSSMSENDLKHEFIKRTQQFLNCNGIKIKFEDCRAIWNCYSVWLDIPIN